MDRPRCLDEPSVLDSNVCLLPLVKIALPLADCLGTSPRVVLSLEGNMKRLVLGLSLTAALFLPTGLAVSTAAANGNGPQYTCSSNGSSYQGLHPGEAKKLERAGYTCTQTN